LSRCILFLFFSFLFFFFFFFFFFLLFLVQILPFSQLNSIAASLDFEWPGSIGQFLTVQQTVAQITTSLLNLDCFLESNSEWSPFFLKTLAFAFVPILVIIGPAIILFPYIFVLVRRHFRRIGCRCCEVFSSAFRELRDLYITSVVVGLFLIHPNVSCRCCSFFSLSTLDCPTSFLYVFMQRTWSQWRIIFAQRSPSRVLDSRALQMGVGCRCAYVAGLCHWYPIVGICVVAKESKPPL
jgi:hypothetical protein